MLGNPYSTKGAENVTDRQSSAKLAVTIMKADDFCAQTWHWPA
ncbi:hypothetical protein [Anaerocolumna chitinilytica]|uniref:Uncharacterized protein n=1 Tax=Anaerocolumna chitinilytica TaxID=1727145 RepID=A0A7I8DNL0_9FIRM|nr:hypothetical protein [Anaerocolumna chitinilytica]BCJ97876.1 hypothetical protein bsdcttw_09170 [Anaerocolumna chitinilytica]